MIASHRKSFNNQFTDAKYAQFLADIDREFGFKVEFKICETPVFIPNDLKNKLVEASQIIVNQLNNPEYRAKMSLATPPQCQVANEDEQPTFLALDFAVCRNEKGELHPQIIELQGFPSLYGYQIFLNHQYRKHYSISDKLTHFFNGYDESHYIKTVGDALLGGNDPENVILMEISPEKQKTRIDFACTERYWGVKAVCITDLKKQGRKLYYKRDGKLVPVHRIYNRMIFDELEARKDLRYDFSFQDDLDLTWAGHPSWFFKISKFSLPFLPNEFVPKTSFLNELSEIPKDLENYVLKPLYSFAGAGVQFDVKAEMIEAIAPEDRHNYILMRKVAYEPLVETLDYPAKVEIRLLMVNTGQKIELLTNLVRLSKGKMMGVDFNKGLNWVGGSLAYFEA
jgi:uncharacterized protein (UPF0248 family)